MVFHIGRAPSSRSIDIKHVSNIDDVRHAANGEFFNVLDHVFEWDNDSVHSDLFKSWRHNGDPTCDAALRQAFPHPSATVGRDLIRALFDHAAAHPDDTAIISFISEIRQEPPQGLLVSEEDVTLAQNLFLDDCVQIIQGLLYYSLAGGLASPHIVRTLEAVSCLLPKPRGLSDSMSLDVFKHLSHISQAASDRTFMRLVETMQFVLDVMTSIPPPSSLPTGLTALRANKISYLMPGGEGWKSTVRVRLLHAVARWRMEIRGAKDDCADTPRSIPISQQELAATLAYFSTSPIWCLHRLHTPPSQRKANAYLALWRHIGFYMGVSPEILHRYFSRTDAADKFTVTVSLNFFFEERPSVSPKHDDPTSAKDVLTLPRGPTLPILYSVSNRAPLYASFAFNIALATHLLGPALAERVGLPPVSILPFIPRLKMHALLLLQRIPHEFSRWYPRRAWREKRREVVREGLAMMVRWNMDMRRSSFRPRTDVRANGPGGDGGELARGVKEAESVKANPVRARQVTKMGKEVLLEMVAVFTLLCIVPAAILWACARHVVYSTF